MNIRRIAVIIYTACIQHVWLGDEQTGYVGQSVVLKSGAQQSWVLTRVQWSIYPNTTLIASMRDGDILTDRFWRHSGRLELNNKTGDLTIKDLRLNDSMIYAVEMVTRNNARKDRKVDLHVQERLKKPNFQQIFHSIKDGQCHIVLKCDHLDKDVPLSLTPSDGFNGSYISGNTSLRESILWTSFSVNKNVTFICTSSRGQQSESQHITVGCTEETKMAKTCSSCSCASMVFIGILCTSMVFCLLCAFQGKLKAACPYGIGHVCRSSFKH